MGQSKTWWKRNETRITITVIFMVMIGLLMIPVDIPDGMFPPTPDERCDKDCVSKGFVSGRYDSEIFQTFEECWCYGEGNVTQIW